tara:strand:+ start:249 stop:437 length:189 start_codon:yes stop_codon:yes gene_type:complete
MNTYIIINGNESVTINKKTLDDAKQFAVMFCDHSHEIIVREIKSLKMILKGDLGNELINLKN